MCRRINSLVIMLLLVSGLAVGFLGASTHANQLGASLGTLQGAVTCPTIGVLPDASLPGATVGSPYSQALTASDGVAPYVFVTSGALPHGLGLSANGVLSGTPTSAGGYSFTVQVVDANGCPGRQDLAMVVSNRSFFDPYAIPVGASILRTIRLQATGDVVSADTLLSGRREWGFDLMNGGFDSVNDVAVSVTHPTMTISGFSDMTGILYPPGVGDPVHPPVIFTSPVIIAGPTSLPGAGSPNDSSHIHQGLANTNVTDTVTPGFDSSRTMSPLIIPPGGGLQTVTVKMTPTDQRYGPTAPSMGATVFGDCRDVIPPSNLDQGDAIWYADCNQFAGHIFLMAGTLNKQYTFTFSVWVANGGSTSITYKPTLTVQSNLNRNGGIVQGTSVTIADNLLGGEAVFAVEENVEWHPGFNEMFMLDYPGVYEVVSDTTPPVVTVPGPITVQATEPAGATVTFTATAVDPDDQAGPVTCTPASGSTFAIGTTTVTCRSTDTHANTGTASFTVTVTAPLSGDMDGDGFISQPGSRVEFEFDVDKTSRGVAGHVEVVFKVVPVHFDGDGCDHDKKKGHHKQGDNCEHDRELRRPKAPNNRFESTSFTAVMFSNDPLFSPGPSSSTRVDTVAFSGTGRWNGQAGYTFTATATDHGYPGSGRDTFAITVRDSGGQIVRNVSAVISGGDIQSERRWR